jgi:hypothetical protein
MATAKGDGNGLSSAGHKIGQVVGDWWELHVVFPLLQEVAKELELFLDNRCVRRDCRSEKILWKDADDNEVDYDFVLELGGVPAKRGVPVAFFESFWRRGARHSKDKARDDTNKLLPMRSTYPTARFLAIAACGEFTEPAREYVRSRTVELLFIPKTNIISAFAKLGLQVDYPDSLSETEKGRLADKLDTSFKGNEQHVATALREIVGEGAFASFKQRVLGALTATPQEIAIRSLQLSAPQVFVTVEDASQFLKSPTFNFEGHDEEFTYEVTYSDGSDFSRRLGTLAEVVELHDELTALVEHMKRVTSKATKIEGTATRP